MTVERQRKIYNRMMRHWWLYGLLWALAYVVVQVALRADYALDWDWWIGYGLVALVVSFFSGGLLFYFLPKHRLYELEKRQKP